MKYDLLDYILDELDRKRTDLIYNDKFKKEEKLGVLYGLGEAERIIIKAFNEEE